MKLQSKLVDRFAIAERRFDQLTEKFAAFTKTLEFFAEPRCPVRGVLITKTEDPLFLVVTYRTAVIGIRMLCELTETGTASARIVCTLEKPSFSAEKQLLGSFSFNGQGFTDHEVAEGEDPVEVEYMAPEIVLSLLHLALQRGAA